MKMRFWQKTYILTLLIFTLCLNIGILSLTLYTYGKTKESAETTFSAEQYYAATSFERDFKTFSETNKNASPLLLMQSYGAHYTEKGMLIAFEKDGKTVYSDLEDGFTAQNNTLVHVKTDSGRYIIISASVCDGEYQMKLAKNVGYLDTEFRSLMKVYTLTSLGVTVILAVILYFVLKKLSKPLEILRKTTEKIESGDFSARVTEQGSDEFTLLTKSFNLMLNKINEQMQASEEQAKQKQMLIDNMAHELRTPLTSIHGYAEYLEKANTTESRRLTAAQYIMSESERLQKISEILLDSAYIREKPTEMKETDIGSILEKTKERLLLKAEKADVELISKTSRMTVNGNETLLSMLFYNLTENAIKACEKGGKVRLSCRDGAVIIRDDGKGMTKEQLSHITEPFYRTDKSRSRADGGAGLGLALCRQIVQTHGAVMDFYSEPGKGTKVTVSFTTRQ